MILVDTLYTNVGGGLVLLRYLVKKIELEDVDAYYLFDERSEKWFENTVPKYRCCFLKPSIKSRTEFYKKNGNAFDKVLCFSNVPPPVKLNMPTYTFFQNLILLSPTKNHNTKEKAKLRLKSLYIQLKQKNSDYFIVQSDNVKEKLVTFFKPKELNVLVLPFYESEENCIRDGEQHQSHFLYVSDGNAHKNHYQLLDAWEIIQQKYKNATLHLTVSNVYPQLINKINEMVSDKKMNIVNYGRLPKTEINKLYQKIPCTIYPSLTESFGLGLIEAIQYGSEVIAADRDYVHAVCTPYYKFEPTSTSSIVEAVSQYIESGVNKPLVKLTIPNKIDELIAIFK